MSRTVKNLITDMYRQRFSDLNEAVLVSIRGLPSNDNNALRAGLAEKQIKVTVVKNTLARLAFKDTGLEPLEELIDGPTALVHGGESVVNVARELIDWAKKLEELELKGAVMEGTVFGADEVERLSKFPTREEAHAQAVTLILSPAKRLAGQVGAPASNIAGILKTIQEKLENGEEITKVA